MKKEALKEKKVSAVIPVYNSEEYIEETIKSLLNQTFELSEIIVIDDNSCDKTYDKVYKISKENNKVLLYKLPENKGVSYARNYGVKQSKSDYILFMDSDDIADCRLVECELHRMIELDEQFKKGCVLVHSAYTNIDYKGIDIHGIHRWKQVGESEILGYEFVRNHISTSGVLLKNSVFNEVGGFDVNINYAEDWDLWLKLASVGGFGYVDETLIKVRRHKRGLSSTWNKMIDSETNILKKYNLEFIKEAICMRNISFEANICDYISILYKLNYWEEGMNQLSQISRGAVEYSTVYFLRGMFYLHIGQVIEAEEQFELAVKYNNRNGAALNNLGALLALKGQFSEAKDKLYKANTYFPAYIDAQKNLSAISNSKKILLDDLKFTCRELRETLTLYYC